MVRYQTKNTMLQNKSTKVISEVKNFFDSSEKGIYRIIELYSSMHLDKLKIGKGDAPQNIHKSCDLLLSLLLFPILSINSVRQYTSHSLYNTIEAGKNTFYRFKNDSSINWRSLLSCIISKLLGIVSQKGSEDGSPKCLIIDDTDFEKTSLKTEHTGKIWSHVIQKCIIGYKGLFLGYWDGKSFFALNFSLHKEKGKNSKKPFGLNAKQKKKQFSKKRELKSPGRKREKELFDTKIDTAIKMIKKAVQSKHVNAEYLLMDSWFFCEKFLAMLVTLKKPIQIIGMIKMAKAKYLFEGNTYTAKELAQILKKRKKVQRVKKLNLYCAEALVEYKGYPLRLYFCKTSKRGKWHLLGSTDVKMGILRAYEIYSIRWTIEVFFKEAKQYFGMGKCQSQDFDAQIADISIAMIDYNIFSLAKRFEAYETLGALFAHSKDQATELDISMRLWGFILELLHIMAEFIDGDFNDMIINILKNKPENNRIIKLIESNLCEVA